MMLPGGSETLSVMMIVKCPIKYNEDIGRFALAVPPTDKIP